MVTKNSAELEFKTLVHKICEGIWIEGIPEELKIAYKNLTTSYNKIYRD